MKRLAQNPLAAHLSQFVQSGRAAAGSRIAAGDDPAQVLRGLERQD